MCSIGMSKFCAMMSPISVARTGMRRIIPDAVLYITIKPYFPVLGSLTKAIDGIAFLEASE